jgi:hypothetical protein
MLRVTAAEEFATTFPEPSKILTAGAGLKAAPVAILEGCVVKTREVAVPDATTLTWVLAELYPVPEALTLAEPPPTPR